MIITYLIGNGFDLNLGMKTSYKDFLQYYLKQPNQNNLIAKFKNDIDKNIEAWSDVEMALGAYTNEFSTDEEMKSFQICHEDIVEKLRIYLTNENKQFLEDNTLNLDQFKKDITFANRSEYLRTKQIKSLDSTNLPGSGSYQYKFINFNYTNTLDSLISNIGKEFETPHPFQTPQMQLKSSIDQVLHIHGSNVELILGVNDVDQIANEEWRKKSFIRSQLIKPLINYELEHEIDNKCVNYINSADLICIYGMSIGETDKLWWKHIISRLILKRNLFIIVYHYDNNYDNIKCHSFPRSQKDIRKKLISMHDTDDENLISSIENRILVVPNSKSPIFNLAQTKSI